jgi:formylmethanofuran dehydrogenase subunit E
VQKLPFHDELALLALVEPTLFEAADDRGLTLAAEAPAAERLRALLVCGRQRQHRVVLVDGALPPAILQPDVRQRLDQILRRNGETEFFAQLIMNEVHEHLGAYSVIGVKMGLYAMEQLNAPPHGMQVVSHVPPGPPASCLDDGVIVATGCTVGRGLWRRGGSPDATIVRVTFTYNARTITLSLREEYRKQVRDQIRTILRAHSLEDARYWVKVRAFGLSIWEHWHRTELFEIEEAP